MGKARHRQFLEDLRQRVLVCDGAMGTMLHSKGISPSRCLEELNLSLPSLVEEVHQAYCQAGADILESNSFGANALRLATYGLEAKCHDINLAGVRLARRAAGEQGLVAGAVGPLGVRLAPTGSCTLEQARAAFREQIEALAEAGADFILLETFRDLNEIREAIVAARAACGLPVVAQVSTDEEGNLLGGIGPETFTRKLTEWGVDAVGCNCGAGPEAALETIRRMAACTDKPLTAQPSAGLPTVRGGTITYPCAPALLADFATRLVRRGVHLVGGCCGATPEHIRAVREAVRAEKPTRIPIGSNTASPQEIIAPVPLRGRNS